MAAVTIACSPPLQVVLQVLDDCSTCSKGDINLDPEAYWCEPMIFKYPVLISMCLHLDQCATNLLQSCREIAGVSKGAQAPPSYSVAFEFVDCGNQSAPAIFMEVSPGQQFSVGRRR